MAWWKIRVSSRCIFSSWYLSSWLPLPLIICRFHPPAIFVSSFMRDARLRNPVRSVYMKSWSSEEQQESHMLPRLPIQSAKSILTNDISLGAESKDSNKLWNQGQTNNVWRRLVGFTTSSPTELSPPPTALARALMLPNPQAWGCHASAQQRRSILVYIYNYICVCVNLYLKVVAIIYSYLRSNLCMNK